MDFEEADQILNQALNRVSEHFDAVQILATWNEEGTTSVIHAGAGNWYARQGMAREFVQQEAGRQNAQAAREVDDESSDSGGGGEEEDAEA